MQVDIGRKELRPDAVTRWKSIACSISFGLFVANTGYKVGNLLYAILFLRETPLHEMVVHTTVAVCAGVLVFWYYVIFLKHPDVHAEVFKITLTGNTGEG